MKRFTTATAKQRFSLLLDAAERGESVIIERRGVRFRVQPERQTTIKKNQRKPVIEIVDPTIAKGEGTNKVSGKPYCSFVVWE